MNKIRVGKWRDDRGGPMQVVSGSTGRERVHFEAPEAQRLKKEMRNFLSWFNSKKAIDPVVVAGMAHFWFVTIHPFEDGNGRLARAIAEMCLARSENSTQRFYSMSAQIRTERKDYYRILEESQRGGLDITPWLDWFLDCLERAFHAKCSQDSASRDIEDLLERKILIKNPGGGRSTSYSLVPV